MASISDSTWDRLRQAARDAVTQAYAPYSNYPVGAAAQVDDGRVVTGCNVENASYGLGLCAECGLVSDLARSGGGKLVAFVCVDGSGQLLAPCGRCRQLLFEHAAPGMVLDMPGEKMTIDKLLPGAFGPANLTTL